MDKWIRDLINSVTSGLSSLINAVAERISWVYNVFITLSIKVRTAFDSALNGIRAKLNALGSLAREAYVTLHWLVFIRIPQFVNNIVSQATNYLVQQLNSLSVHLQGLITNVRDWAVRQIQIIDTFINQVISWISAKINAIIDDIKRIASLVYNVLTDPKHLAAWAIEAIVDEFLLWANKNADRLFLIVRQRSVQYTMQAANRIEDMITRLL